MSECFKCKGLCCKYITIDVEAPREPEDWDEIRWFLLHKNVVIYKTDDEKNWRSEFQTSCDYLDDVSNKCMKYEIRPDVCKDYALDECGKLDEMSPEGCEIYMETEEDLRRYLKDNLPDMEKLVFKFSPV